MKKENTSIRIRKIMEEQNLRQVDILELVKPYCSMYNVKMNKSDISQYVSGKVEPNQDKLVILGMALNVNEAWLMGFDVPRKRSNFKEDEEEKNIFFSFTPIEKRIITEYRNADEISKAMIHRVLSIDETDYQKKEGSV